MEPERFDELAASVAEGETSRRSVLFRFGGGTLAGLLATLGVGGLDVEEADAKKSCRKRCKKRKTAAKRRRCRRRCKKGVGPECRGTGDCQGTDICVDNTCIDRPAVPVACDPAPPDECDGALICVSNICVLPCEDDDDCQGGLLCIDDVCVLDDECVDDDDCELFEICLLGLCVLNL